MMLIDLSRPSIYADPTSVAFYGPNYDKLIQKTNDCNNQIQTERESLDSSCLNQSKHWIHQYKYPLIAAPMPFGILIANLCIQKDSTASIRAIASLFGGLLSTIPSIYALIGASKKLKEFKEKEMTIESLERELASHQQAAICANSVAAFHKKHEEFFNNPTLDSLKSALDQFKQIPSTSPFGESTPESFSGQEIKEVCILFLIDAMLKKYEEQSEEKLLTLSFNQALNGSSCSIWGDLKIEKPSQGSIDFFIQNKEWSEKNNVVEQITKIHKEILSKCYSS